MAQRIEAWGNVLEFPDDMSDDDIATAIKDNEANLNPEASTFTKAKAAGLSMLTPQKSIAQRAEDTAPEPGTLANSARNRSIVSKALASTEPVPDEGGFINSAARTVGQNIKGAGQIGADYLGADQNNAVKQYGQSIVDANPTAVNSLEDIADKPGTAVAEATGNAAPSMAGMVGARAIGQGITALSPLAGPAAPVVAAVGQVVSWLGPAAIASLPSYGGIRDKQIINDPKNEKDAKAIAIATMGAAAVGAIEQAFGPQQWALAAMTKEGRVQLAKKFAATTLPGAVGKGAVKGAAIEGAEELAQNPIEQLASFDNPTTPENIKDTLFGGAMGAIGGGVLGGATGGAFRGEPVPTIAGKPVTEHSDNVLKYTAARGGERAKAAAQAEIKRRAEQGVDPTVANAPETTSDAVDRIIETGRDKAQEIEDNAATATDSIQSDIFEEEKAPDEPTPEPVETLQAQAEAVEDGRKPAMLITPGESIPTTLPEDIKAAEIPGSGTLLFKDEAALKAAKDGKMGEALGYGIDEKPADATHAITTRDKDGTVIQDVATDGSPSIVKAAIKAAGPKGKIEVRPIVEAIKERKAKIDAQKPTAQEPVKKGTVGGMLGSGEIVLTATGRTTTPFPKVNVSGKGQATRTLNLVDQWLISNAAAEAQARGDDFNHSQFANINHKNISQSDKDSAEFYLFHDEQPKVQRSILKDLIKKPDNAAKVIPVIQPKTEPEPKSTRLDHGELNIKGRTNNINNELDKYKKEQANLAKTKSKASSVPESGTGNIRPLIEALIKRRAAANQINKGGTFDKALAAAKKLMAGEEVKPARFKSAAALLGNDPVTAGIVMQLHDKAKAAQKTNKQPKPEAPSVATVAIVKPLAPTPEKPKETKSDNDAYHYTDGDYGMTSNGQFTRDKTRWITFTPSEARRMDSAKVKPHGATRLGLFVGTESAQRIRDTPEPAKPEPKEKEIKGPTQKQIDQRKKLSRQARERRFVTGDDTMNQAIIKMGGIHESLRNDLISDKKGNQKIAFVGHLFNPRGSKDLSDLARDLQGKSYFTQQEIDGVDGGAALLAERLRSEFMGGQPHRAFGSDADEDYDKQINDHYEQLAFEAQQKAKLLGVDFDGIAKPENLEINDEPVTPENLVNAELIAKAITLDPAMVEEIVSSMGFSEGEVTPEFMEAVAQIIKDSENAGIQVIENREADIEAHGVDQNASEEDIFGEDFLLEPQTPEELKAAAEESAKKEKEEKSKADSEEKSRKKAADEAAIKDKAKTAADNFKLGGNAEDEISGQGGMFSRSPPSTNPNHSNVETVVEAIRAKWKNSPDVVIIDSMDDAPAEARAENDRQLSQGATGNPEGFISGGKVYIVASEMKSPDDVRRVLLHESLGHYGLRGVFGADLQKILRRVYLLRRRDVTAKAKQYGLDISKKEDQEKAAEEVLSEMAQDNPQIGFVKRAIAAIRAWLRKNIPGFENIDLTDNEITQQFLIPARAFVERGQMAPVQGVGAFSRPGLTILKDHYIEAKKKFNAAMADKTAKPQNIFKLSEDITDTRKSLAAQLEKLPDDGFLLQGATGRGQMLLLNQSAQKQDHWQLTRFDIKGEPWGDTQYKTKKQAIDEFLQDADPATVTDIKTSFSRSGQSNLNLQGGQAGSNASWDAPEPSKIDDLIYKLQNKNIDLKRVIESVQASGAQLADKWNAYLQEELFHGRAAKRTQDFVNKELKPIMLGMKLRGQSVDELDKYLHARHAEEANNLIAQRDPNMPDGGSGMTTKDARAYLASIPADKLKALENTAKQVDTVIAKTRDLYVSYGLVDKDTADSWEQMFKHYVPLMREDNDGGMGVGQGFSIKGKEVKHRTGSKRKVVDILANIALQREKAIVRGEKNRVAVSLAGLAKLNPNPDFWTFENIPQKHFDPATGQVVMRADPMYKNRDNVVVAKVKNSKGDIVEMAVIFNERNDRAMRMAQAMKNLDATQLEGLLGVSAKVTRYFAAINTQYNPVFGVVNLTRDIQASLLNLSSTRIAGSKAQVLKNILPAIKAVYSSTRGARKGNAPVSPMGKLWDEMQQEGGMTGYRDLFKTSEDRANAIKRELDPTEWMNSGLGKVFTAGGALKVPLAVAQKRAGWLFDLLSDYNQTLEGATRLSVYKVAIEKGLSKPQAASIAKNISVNFNRKGQSGQQAGALYAFFNAAMQGTARIGETMTTMDKGDIKTLRFNRAGKTIIAGGITLGVLQALALSAAGFDDDEPPEFVRERSLIIPIGDKKYISVPMPLGFHAIPNIGRIATEFTLGGFKNPAAHVTRLLAVFMEAFNPIGASSTFTQTLSPTVTDPLVALAENKDWTGKPIFKEDFSKLSPTPGFSRTKDTASDPAKLIAEAINTISGGNKYVPGMASPTPDQIDYLFGQITGGVGREAGKAQQSIKAAATGEDLPAHKIPLVGRFYGNSAGQTSQGNAFYANLKRLNEVEAELKGRMKDRLPTSEFKAENPEYRLTARANFVEGVVSKQRKKKSELIKNDAPREKIKEIDEQITKLMTGLNNKMKELKQGSHAVQ